MAERQYSFLQVLDEGKNILNPQTLVKVFLQEYSVCFCNKEFYIYNEDSGLWEKKDKTEMKKLIAGLLSEKELRLWKPKFRDRILEYLDIYVKDYSYNEGKHRYLLALKNVILDLKEKKTYEYSPDFFFTSKSEFDYNPTATAPLFQNFLNTCCEGDNNLERMLEELLGLFLTNRTVQHVFYLWGEGSNGKSIYMGVARNLVGCGNFITLEPEQLKNAFTRTYLQNKKVLVLNDLSKKNSQTIISSQIKGLTGGENVSAEIKYKGNIEFTPHCKIIATSNYMPFPEKESTHGDERRIFLIPFKHKVLKKDRDELLAKRLKKELPGILNIALAGLDRLQENNFRFSFDGEEEWKKILGKENPISLFVEEKIKKSNGKFLKYSDIRKIYAQWCADNNIEEGYYASGDFANEISNHFSIEKGVKRGGERGVLNVSIKE